MKELIKKVLKGIFEKTKEENIFSLFKKTIFRIRKLFYVLYLKTNVKKFDINFTTESLIDFVFNYGEGLLNPLQVRSEILKLIQIVKKQKPKVILEIGTANGGTIFLFSRIADKDAIIISIDLPGGRYGGGYPEWRSSLYKSFCLSNQRMYLIRANSHEEFTLNKIKDILNGAKLDFIFIDGDHTYAGVKKDFETYKSLTKEKALIAFHDIVIHPVELNVGVNQFWNEIKQKYEYIEIVENWDQKRCGIGILKKK